MDIDRDLIMQCLKQDLVSQRVLYTRLASKMYPVCRQFARNESEADDILQNGFIRVFSHLHQYRFEGSFEGWVRKIIISTAINFNKQQPDIDHEVEIEDLGFDVSLYEDALSRLSEKDLLTLIQDIPRHHWDVFRLHEIEGYGHKEIGAILGIPEGTSKSHLHRARMSIRRILKERGLTEPD